ncbi:aquaporin [Staphylococcus pasteuri]|uniref:MIP/aquaporin family protein n=1 Tax=Staphylococcus pasteuri TaxID=45972 RepID=UPI000D3771E2|nr:MIP family channel protein [Staphylococcus pasteuri]PTU84311.1 aquaporin [Staphylococcus pasteuri]
MKKYIAELLGTFILVFFGTGTAVLSTLNTDNSVGILGVSFAFGLAVIAAAYSIGDISGGHLNPAISFAMFLDKRIEMKDFLLYTVFQIIGAILASTLISIILHTLKSNTKFNYGANIPNNISNIGAFVIETILTFIFIFVVLSVTKTKFIAPSLSVLVIGFTLTMIHLVGIPLTGTSVNPARSIGPALFTGNNALSALWIFVLAPLLGSIVAALVHRFLEKA